jgi:hypothetical protein
MAASAGTFILTSIDTILSKGFSLNSIVGQFSLIGKNVKLWINGTSANWIKLTKPTTIYTSLSKPTTTYTQRTKPTTIWTNVDKP